MLKKTLINEMSINPGDEIIKEILNGNEKIIGQIYKNVYKHIDRHGSSINASAYNIKESVQDAFEVFYRKILKKKKLRLNCSVETYLISIAKNLLHENERKLGFFNTTPISSLEIIDDNEIKDIEYRIKEQKQKLFIEEFNKLSYECKRIIKLTLEGYTAAQIKTMMNLLSEEYVYVKRLRCKRFLTKEIKNRPDYEKLRDANPENFELSVWRDEQRGEKPV